MSNTITVPKYDHGDRVIVNGYHGEVTSWQYNLDYYYYEYKIAFDVDGLIGANGWFPEGSLESLSKNRPWTRTVQYAGPNGNARYRRSSEKYGKIVQNASRPKKKF